MRLWHKDLIHVLPRHQLLSQWRECCCIARNIAINGTPNHILVNKVLEYPLTHFYRYTKLVEEEMTTRGYKCDFSKFDKYMSEFNNSEVVVEELFYGWHNRRYYMQCYHNLEEKYDCGGISIDEWSKVRYSCNERGGN